ncbi:glutathione S-transferase theta-1-like isoform X2 [Erythrolamprus reginae]|uniref:glutathione S-transferase theta-1-like isoform X2 n=1 Tax=Erythrolamprus reginae TaxID=121349 RepID=UPI00396CD9FC
MRGGEGRVGGKSLWLRVAAFPLWLTWLINGRGALHGGIQQGEHPKESACPEGRRFHPGREHRHPPLPEPEVQHSHLLVPTGHEEAGSGGRVPGVADQHHPGGHLQNPLAQVSPEKLYDAMEELQMAVQKVEEKFLRDKPFLIGPEISLADLVAIVELMQPLGAGCDILEGRPKLQEWRKRVELTLGKELFLEAHSRILNTQELRSIIIDPPLKTQMKPLLLKLLK